MIIAQKTGSDPVIEPDPVRSGVCMCPFLSVAGGGGGVGGGGGSGGGGGRRTRSKI